MSENDQTTHVSMAGTPRPAVGDMPTVIGDFRIAERIGAGAMGEVYLGTHAVTGQEAAIKVVSPRLAGEDGFAKRFQREIDSLTRLDHPNIARAIAHGVHDGRPWLAMEFVRGPNLADLQRQQGALHETTVLRLAIQIARGLEHVHAKAGLVHRDIKPANVLISVRAADDEVEHVAKLIDFGLAKSLEAGTTDQSLTMTGMVMGTPFYMSPEQIRGDRGVDHRTDIYALGATMYHLLTNKLPYEGSSPGMVMTAHLTAKVPDPGDRVPSLHKSTRRLVMMAMAKSPDDRFLTYQGFIIACGQALTDIAERDQGTVRLLRKPLVLPGVNVRAATPPLLDAHTAATTPVAGAAPAVAQPAKLRTPRPGPAVVGAPSPITAPARPLSTPATHALRKVHTDRIRRLRADSEGERLGTSRLRAPEPPKPVHQSAVYRADVPSRPVWPMSLLLLALLALIMYLLL